MAAQTDNPAEAFARAGDLFSAHDYAGASAIYEALRARFPSNPEPTILLGCVAVRQGDHAGAIEQFTRALVLEKTTRTLCLRATSHLALGQIAEAMRDVDTSLTEDPSDPTSRLLRARILTTLRQTGEARAIVDDLLVSQEHPGALELSAEIHDLAGDPDSAARDRARAKAVSSGPAGGFRQLWKPRR